MATELSNGKCYPSVASLTSTTGFGFLMDTGRTNTLMTRPRCRLIVIGNCAAVEEYACKRSYLRKASAIFERNQRMLSLTDKFRSGPIVSHVLPSGIQHEQSKTRVPEERAEKYEDPKS